MDAMKALGTAVGLVGLATLVGCSADVGPRTAASPVSATADAPGQSRFEQPPGEAPVAGLGADTEARQPRKDSANEESRPGLGTEWGETRFSHISSVSFVRADADSPFATAAVFYNDAEGARAMSNAAGFRRWSGGAFSVANNLVSVGLKDERGGFLSGFVAGEKNFAIGENGSRYTIAVHNNTDARLEIVLSVDGLDVLDGKAASFAKRGYLVDPRGDLEVDGFRQSSDTVAAFRFGSVRDSYANQKHGETRNVGVIGVAVFNERGTSPLPWNASEVNRRQDANPFPGQFATPP